MPEPTTACTNSSRELRMTRAFVLGFAIVEAALILGALLLSRT